jgi:hypothetical protein
VVGDAVQVLALSIAGVGLAALVALALMAFGLGVMGPVNDVLGGIYGVLTLLLAVAMRDLLPQSAAVRALALAAALAGTVLVVIGSALVLKGITGWYLAGLWSALGWGLLGLWLLVLTVGMSDDAAWSTGLVGLGVMAGVLMTAGLGVLPGVIGAVDDSGSATWRLAVPQLLGYLGALLFLVWCLVLGWPAADTLRS